MRFLIALVCHPVAFIRGVLEFRRCFTWADPDRSEANGWRTERDDAYDWGRETAHALTGRRFDD